MKRLLELPQVIILSIIVIVVLILGTIGDTLHWLFWKSIGVIWITIEMRMTIWKHRTGYKKPLSQHWVDRTKRRLKRFI